MPEVQETDRRNFTMKTNAEGLALIKSFEGCRLTAYKPVAAEKYWTIGYGHYGPDVKQGMRITQAQADAYLVQDLARFEKAVNSLGRTWTENQFSALVSFTYNCGEGNLITLCRNRSADVIAQKLLLYSRNAAGQSMAGLVRRRKAEQSLFLKKSESITTPDPAKAETKTEVKNVKQYAAVVNVSTYLNVRTAAGSTAQQYKVGGSAFRLPPGMVIAIEAEQNSFGKLAGLNAWVSLNYIRKE